MTKVTTKARVLSTLNTKGFIRTVDAKKRGITELRKVIYNLRNEGVAIDTVRYARKSDGQSVAKYVLV